MAQSLLRNSGLSPIISDASLQPLLQDIWSGLDPAQVWDCHVHLVGTGDGDSGIQLGQKLTAGLNPIQHGQLWFYMNGAGVDQRAVDQSYVTRLQQLCKAMPPGYKVLLLAFDRLYSEAGQAQESSLYVPNDYACRIAQALPDRFEYAASIHPYRQDCLDTLHKAIHNGARALKWLPSAMGIDPASPRCDALYRAAADAKLPLIIHSGTEHAIKSDGRQHLNNPLRVRRALDAGVRVVLAHCASLGMDHDIDQGASGRTTRNFDLFCRLMDEPRARGLLFGDISALILRNRAPSILQTLLSRNDWHARLLNGSDYPLPGILPLIAPSSLAKAGLLPPATVPALKQLRLHNPLLFDFAIKRLLRWQGQSFAASVFETRSFFV